MSKLKYKYIYGPVPSWRLGSSLGIDMLSQEQKICTFDCIYCQLGKNLSYSIERKIYVPTQKIIEELKSLPEIKIDYITFSGTGEPTLAKNFAEAIKAVKALRKEPVAVLTNSSLMDKKEVRRELSLADFVICKLDGFSQGSLEEIDNPAENIKFEKIVNGIKEFRKEYTKKLALQIMFVENNKGQFKQLADISKEICPDEIQINTPLRPCPVKPLSKEEVDDIKEYFNKMFRGTADIVTVYEGEHKKVLPISEKDTLTRRGKI